MSFEALNCANCGSGDVQEVKPSTYFCNHCESVFKHIDPTRVTVAPSFCDHGNLVRFQCQICKTGMCYQCDALAAWSKDNEAGIVRTEGFGYLNNHRIYDDTVKEPFLPVGKLLMSLLRSHNGVLSHVCYGCVTKAVPIAAEYIASGMMCQMAQCWSGSGSERCFCCHGGSCERCSRVTGGPLLYILWGDTRTVMSTLYSGKKIVGWWPEHSGYGLCRWCVTEWHKKAEALAVAICRQDYAGKLDPAGSDEFVQQFKVVAVPVRKRKEREDSERQKAVAERYASEITDRVKGLMVVGGPCKREEHGYDILDERDCISPTAVSEVIWVRPLPALPTRRYKPSH